MRRKLWLLVVFAAFLVCWSSQAFAVDSNQVENVKVTTSNTTGSLSKKMIRKGYRPVFLSWKSIKDASGYKIYFSTKRTGKYRIATKGLHSKKPADTILGSKKGNTTRYTLAFPKKKVYYFKVSAVTKGKETKMSDWVSVKVAGHKTNVSSFKIKGKQNIKVGDTVKLKVKFKKRNPKRIRWISSNPSLASVNSQGIVKGRAVGKVTITAIAHNGKRNSVSMYVSHKKSKNLNKKKEDYPRLLSLDSYPQKEKDVYQVNILKWNAAVNGKYQILRRAKGKYRVIATVTAKKKTQSYQDKKVRYGVQYYYTVRQVKKGLTKVALGKYDKQGISSISPVKNLYADFANLRGKVKWNKVPGASYYIVERADRKKGKRKEIGRIGNTSFVDIYRQTCEKFPKSQDETGHKRKYLCDGHFADPSINTFIYNVKAVRKSKDTMGRYKYSYSHYYKDGYFTMGTPPVLSYDDKSKELVWGQIKHTEKYTIYKGQHKSGRFNWIRVKTTKPHSGVQQKAVVDFDANNPYFSVVASADRNGKTISSQKDDGFSLENRKYENTKVLFLGDSITYGSPYRAKSTRHIFSYPHRIGALTGVQYFNPSIPGATLSHDPGERKAAPHTNNYIRSRISTGIADKILEGEPTDQCDVLGIPRNYSNIFGKGYAGYDVVVIAAGTNDYADLKPFTDNPDDIANLDNRDNRNVTGALNSIVSYLEEASEKRIKDGKKPIKVVFLDLFYSDRIYDYEKRQNRFVTKNDLEYTLTDYQDQLNKLIDHYEKVYNQEGGEKNNKLSIYHFKTDDYEFVTQENCPYTTSDNLHMTRLVYAKIGSELTEFMVNNKILEK